MDVHVNKNSDGDRKIGTAFCTPSGIMGIDHRLKLSFAEEHALLLRCQSMGIQGGRNRIGEVQPWVRTTFKLRKEPSRKTVMSLLFFVLSYSRCIDII